jgi:hypothetical protein
MQTVAGSRSPIKYGTFGVHRDGNLLESAKLDASLFQVEVFQTKGSAGQNTRINLTKEADFF